MGTSHPKGCHNIINHTGNNKTFIETDKYQKIQNSKLNAYSYLMTETNTIDREIRTNKEEHH